ncbi:MAG: hypothetical protein QNK20_16525 [Aureibaculum sp.]|nr:hypothetical protein [Aureibaculum sp.]
MNIWESYAAKFQSIDVFSMVAQIIKELENVILDINRGDQLYLSGQLSDGSFLPDYRSGTIAEKVTGSGDKRIENMTLRDSGSFYNGFNLRVTTDKVEVYSSDSKTPELVGAYGKNIFGLTDENWQDLVDSNIVPSLTLRICKVLE